MAECYSQENPFHILQKEQLLGLRPIPGWYFVWIGLATGIARIVEVATGIVRIVEVATEIVGGVNYFEQFWLYSFMARKLTKGSTSNHFSAQVHHSLGQN